MPDRTVQLAPLSLRAAVQSNTLNEDARTVELVFSTGAAVPRFDWLSGERYLETLSLKPGQVRLDRLNNSAPFLNGHSAEAVSDVLGVVEPGTARLADGQATAVVRFSKRAEVEPIFQDVKDGIVKHVSVGYRVHRYEVTEGGKNQLAVRHAVDWEPYEISAVPMGADDGATVRADAAKAAAHPCVLVTRTKETPAMEPIEQPAEPQVETEPNDRDKGAAEERARVQGIIRACQAARLPQSTADKLIADGTSLLEAQSKVLDTLRGIEGPLTAPSAPRQPGSTVRITGADPLENVWRGITGALLHRLNPGWFELDDNARQYRGLSILRAAEECIEQRTHRKTRGMSSTQITLIALGLDQRAALHTTSDFANILADVANKSLRRAYEDAPATWMPLARRISMPDFKPVKRNVIGEAPELKKVLEHGEITRGTIGEGKEEFRLSTYARMFGITRQALVNDDLDAFNRTAVSFGRAARRKENDLVWAEIMRNAAMGDGVALFHATHGNLTTGPGTAIDVPSLGVGRALMQKQTGLESTTYLNLEARYLVTSPTKRTLAEQYTSVIQPNQGSAVNPFSGKLQVISEARLEGGLVLDGETIAGSANAWYLFASPDQIDLIEYGFLDGEEGPRVESKPGWDVDGLEIRCAHDFAAKVIDHRGAYKNDGA